MRGAHGAPYGLFTQTMAMLFAPERRLRTLARLSHQGGEMIAPRFGLMKYIPVFHPFGVALRSKSVPDGLVTKDFAKERNNLVYFRLSKMLCGFKDQVRARPSGETGGLRPAPAPLILVRNAG